MFTHRNLIGLSLFLLVAAVGIGLLNKRQVNGLRSALASAVSSQENASRLRVEREKALGNLQKQLSDLKNKVGSAEARARKAETELQRSRGDMADLESKLQSSEAQLAELQKKTSTTKPAEPPARTDDSSSKLMAELDETKRRNIKLEQERSALAQNLEAAQGRVKEMEAEKARHRARAQVVGVRGTVLAVNQAYNFVVLSIGERQGAVANSEMLVMRSGSVIGRIRISSVEPTTSIGDIITNSLAHGVQVQPGDTVIYAGDASS